MMSPIKEPDLALAGVALLVIFGLVMWYDRPTESPRAYELSGRHQDRHLIGDAYESWLWEDPFAFEPKKEKEKKPEKGQCKDQLEKKITDIKKITPFKNPVKILAPVLKVRPNPMDKELRIRDRYAVIAGLIESGYRPLESDSFHFCSIQNSDKEYDVRWEHYRHESKKDERDKDEPDKDELDNNPDIIVVWMNSEIFTPDNKIPGDDKFTFELENLLISKKINKNKFYIFDLNNIFDRKHFKTITKNIEDIQNKNKNKNIEIKRADTNVKALTEKLTRELVELRKIKPSEVMIITEQDSENIRNLAQNFCESLQKSFTKDKPKKVDVENNPCEIKNIFYLKGVDAYQQRINKQDKNEAAHKRADPLSVINLHNFSPLPIGPSQLDYLHRLAEQIKGPHTDINLQKRDSGIKAVGVFGSDFNDKLLILEALRAEMPNILVFTTDLDAQMLHPQYWRAARNLVVASHFNLLLEDNGKEQYQKQLLAFRDSQQTNIFYRTINIVKSQIPSPQIFEIGRNSPVRLATEKNEDINYHPPDGALDQTTMWLCLLGAIIISLVGFHWSFRPNSGKLSIYLLLSTFAIFAIAWVFASDELGEPLSFKDGISLWPTVFIQLIAILLAFAFFFRAKRELDENFCRLSRQYFSFCCVNQYFSFCCLIRQYFSICLKKCGPWLRRLGILSCFIWTFAIYAFNDVYPSSLQFGWCLALLVLSAIFYLGAIETWDFVSIKGWIEKDNCQVKKITRYKQENYEEGLWWEYEKYGLLGHRVSRVVAIWLFFAIIETVLIYLLPPWPLPCRGDTCGWVSSWTGVISFVVIMILLFCVLDAVRLSFHWIQKLRKQHPLLADRITVEDSDAFNNATKNKPLQSLENIVDVVAERTAAVDKLIYYPMLCIMLMLFAKITYFDNQDFPLSKGITFAASISLLFFAGFMLRYEAEQLKLSVIKSAENLGKDNKCDQEKVDKAIERIKDISDGAFQPMFEQPVMRALLIILASIGIFAAKYLKLFE